MDEKTQLKLFTQDAQSAIAQVCMDNPESVYDQLVQAEKWVKELKEKARGAIIKRHPVNVPVMDIQTDNYTVHSNRNKPKLKPEEIFKGLTALGLDPYTVVYKKPVEYLAFPNAPETLETLLKSGILSQAVYDTFFDEPNYTVTIKPKSAKAIVSGE